MKTLITSFLMLLCGLMAQAQNKLHAYIFADTDDIELSQSCFSDKTRVKDFVNKLSGLLKFTPDIQLFTDDKFSPQAFHDFYRSVAGNPGDIFILYVSSHGERTKADNCNYYFCPHVKFKSDKLESFCNAYNALKKLPHTTCIGIMDACNTFGTISPQDQRIYSKGFNPPQMETLTDDYVKTNAYNLFIKNKFDLIITSSQINVTALGNNDGGVFTKSFIASLNYVLALKDPVVATIGQVLDRTDSYTLRESKRQYKAKEIAEGKSDPSPEHVPHYPMYDIVPAIFSPTYVPTNAFVFSGPSAEFATLTQKWEAVKNAHAFEATMLNNYPQSLSVMYHYDYNLLEKAIGYKPDGTEIIIVDPKLPPKDKPDLTWKFMDESQGSRWADLLFSAPVFSSNKGLTLVAKTYKSDRPGFALKTMLSMSGVEKIKGNVNSVTYFLPESEPVIVKPGADLKFNLTAYLKTGAYVQAKVDLSDGQFYTIGEEIK